MLFIFALGLLALEMIRMVLRIKRESEATTRRVHSPRYKRQCRKRRVRVLRASRPGRINLEETDLYTKKGEKEMKNWKLEIKHGWRTNLTFKFKKLTEAEAFLDVFIEARQTDSDEDKEESPWEYNLMPLLDEENATEAKDGDHDE